MLPCATLVTPNLHEAAALTGLEVNSLESMKESARRLAGETGAAILVKGGHLTESATDILFESGHFHEFAGQRFDTPHTHGTGCTYSAAITACLALGLPLVESVARAKRFITEAIRTNPGLGHGNGPVNHHASSI
jgi:hydroxymethylpyrimidine/phosphomethylpyrimidine kinase